MSITRCAKSGSIGMATSGLSSLARSASAGRLAGLFRASTVLVSYASVAGENQLDADLFVVHLERAHDAPHVGRVLGVEVRSDGDRRNRNRQRLAALGQLEAETAGNHVGDFADGVGHLAVD